GNGAAGRRRSIGRSNGFADCQAEHEGAGQQQERKLRLHIEIGARSIANDHSGKAKVPPRVSATAERPTFLVCRFGCWDLDFGICLGFGFWILGFPWILELGSWSFAAAPVPPNAQLSRSGAGVEWGQNVATKELK